MYVFTRVHVCVLLRERGELGGVDLIHTARSCARVSAVLCTLSQHQLV